MYKKYNNNNCGRTQPIMGTWSCRKDNWCDREEDERDCRNWCDREEDERGHRDRCEHEEDERDRRNWLGQLEEKAKRKNWRGRAEGERGRSNCDEECENTINIYNKVCINQDANAQGGNGGDGGDAENGDATGGSAAAASGLIAVAANVTNPEIEIPISDDLLNKGQEQAETEIEPLQADGGTVATGGSATVGTAAGGAGGSGGNGGTATNTATVSIENVVIITCNSDTPGLVTLGTNGRSLDIKVDEKGSTFVNGEKMEEKVLSDGTKVLIFRSSQTE